MESQALTLSRKYQRIPIGIFACDKICNEISNRLGMFIALPLEKSEVIVENTATNHRSLEFKCESSNVPGHSRCQENSEEAKLSNCLDYLYSFMDMSTNTSSKAGVRKQIRQLIAQLGESEIAEGSRDICDQLEFSSGTAVAIFAGLTNEPQLLELIECHPEVKWHLPKVIGPGQMDFIRIRRVEELSRGAFGVLEPLSGAKASHLDVIVCPGVAFTSEGLRLGQGGGFYDRVIPRFPKARILGVGFQCQIVSRLPVEKHDCRMDQIISPRTDT